MTERTRTVERMTTARFELWELSSTANPSPFYRAMVWDRDAMEPHWFVDEEGARRWLATRGDKRKAAR